MTLFKRFYCRGGLHHNPFNRYFDYSDANYLVNEEEIDEYKKKLFVETRWEYLKAKVTGVLDFINRNLVAKDKKEWSY